MSDPQKTWRIFVKIVKYLIRTSQMTNLTAFASSYSSSTLRTRSECVRRSRRIYLTSPFYPNQARVGIRTSRG